MMGALQGRVALITGAAAGFGEAIARRFVAEGAKVLVADLEGARAQDVATSLGASARAVRCDVSSRADVDAAVAACVDAFGGVDILVNNAGTTHRNQSMLEVDEATFDRVFAVNVKSIFHTTQAVVPLMKARRSGCIVNIGSTAGIRPRPGLTWYNASKGAVNLLSKSMAAELGPDGIRVNAVCPVMSRMSTPEDVAEATLYLASDAARFITGVELPVDGGRTI
jgi:3-oxoacyl-[acyl-carrier protein] reductase